MAAHFSNLVLENVHIAPVNGSFQFPSTVIYANIQQIQREVAYIYVGNEIRAIQMST